MHDFYTPTRSLRSNTIKQQLLRGTRRRIPPTVDLHYITERLLVASQPVNEEEASYNDTGRNERNATQTPSRPTDVTVEHGDGGADDTSLSLPSDLRSRRTGASSSAHLLNPSSQRSPPQPRNTSAALARYLDKRHARQYLCVNLTGKPPSDQVLEDLHRQIVTLPASPAPTLTGMLHICYVLAAWLGWESTSTSSENNNNNNNSTVAVLYCANGKTRSALAIACFLKFAGLVDQACTGFGVFLERHDLPLREVLAALPASVHTLFRNLDASVELQACPHSQPLVLRAISLQGIPVEDKPCLDLYCNGKHVYSSHPDVFEDLPSSGQQNSQWAEEEGFYWVGAALKGDFCLQCRFGGPYAADTADASKLIFRYANSTGFVGAMPLELHAHDLDLMRRYAHLIETDDFLVSLLFETNWETNDLEQQSPEMTVLEGYAAMEEGWQRITDHHAAQPDAADVEYLKQQAAGQLHDCPEHIVSLALQLTNFDWDSAHELLVGRLQSWWGAVPEETAVVDKKEEVTITPEHKEARDRILSLVQDVDLGDIGLPPVEQREDVAERSTRLDPPIRYTSPILQPNAGDIVNAFGLSKPQICPRTLADEPDYQPRPTLPILPLPQQQSTATTRPAPLDDPSNQLAVQVLLELNHPGVALQDLLEFQRVMQNLDQVPTEGAPVSESGPTVDHAVLENALPSSKRETAKALTTSDKPTETTKAKNKDSPNNPDTAIAARYVPLKDDPRFSKYYKMLQMKVPRGAVENCMTKDEADLTLLDLDPEKSFQSQGAAAGCPDTRDEENPLKDDPSLRSGAAEDHDDSADRDEELPLKDDPCFSKYYKMLKMKLPRGAVENSMTRDGADLALLDLDPEKSLKSQRQDTTSEEDGPPLKDDPLFSKYYQMLKMKLPRGAVENAMARDGADATILDLDPEKSLQSQRKTESAKDEPPLKDDPCFSKYYKMLKMKLPRGAVENAMARDGADATLLDLDPEKSLKSQRKTESAKDDEPPLKDDPCFSKYYKMLKMKLPRGAVENAMARDGADATMLDLDPEKSLKSQRKSESAKDDGPPLKDDPCFSKYYKMLKMKLPHGAVENAMARDGADKTLLDLDPEKSLQSQRKTESAKDDEPPLKDDPCFSKYYKMLKMKLPRGAVENAMARDGADATLLDLDPEKSLKSQRKSETTEDDGPPLKDDPCFSKYYKMLKMKLPRGAVENAMARDGADPTLLDLDPEKSLKSQRLGEKAKDDGPPLKDDPCFSKYYKMLKMKLPRGAVENAMARDGADLTLLDLDPEKSLNSQKKGDVGGKALAKPVKKKRVRRKKIYWNPIDPREIKEDSLWSIVKGKFEMNKLDYDVKEFEDLFTESADPKDRKKKETEKPKAKKSVQVIDGKRSMNGGIILKRLKMDNRTIAKAVDSM